MRRMISKYIAFARVLFLAAIALAAAAPTVFAADEADLRIDQQLRAFEDPQLIQILTSAPRPRIGQQGPQPFNQEPPAAQSDFQTPTVTCFINQQQQLVCQ